MAGYEIESIGNDTYRVSLALSDDEVGGVRLDHLKATGLNVAVFPQLQIAFTDGRIELDESDVLHRAKLERLLFSRFVKTNPAFVEELIRQSSRDARP